MKKFNVATEHQIQSAIMQGLTAMGIFCWRNNSGMIPIEENGKRRFVKMGTAGLPDILGVLPPNGRLLAIEVKRPGGKLTVIQEHMIKLLKDTGALAFVAYDWNDVAEQIKLYRKEKI